MRAIQLAVLLAILGPPACCLAAGRHAGPGRDWDSPPREVEDGSLAWRPVDRLAERIFRSVDSSGDGLLTDVEAKQAVTALRRQLDGLVRRGALRGIPPTALNAQATGLKLPGQEKTSQPEFVLFARSQALRLANSNPGR